MVALRSNCPFFDEILEKEKKSSLYFVPIGFSSAVLRFCEAREKFYPTGYKVVLGSAKYSSSLLCLSL